MDEITHDPFLAGLRQDPGYAEIISGKSGGAGAPADKNKN
jgi:hypothetical protein